MPQGQRQFPAHRSGGSRIVLRGFVLSNDIETQKASTARPTENLKIFDENATFLVHFTSVEQILIFSFLPVN